MIDSRHFGSGCVLLLTGSHLVTAVPVDHFVRQDEVCLNLLLLVIFADAAPGEVVGGGEVGVELFRGQGFVVVLVMGLLVLLWDSSGVADVTFVVAFS